MKQINRYVVVVMLLVALQLSCGMKQGKEAGERAAQKFHTQLNAGQFHDIYSQADEAFQKAISEGDATALFDAVRRKLGTVQEAKPTAWFVNANTGGTFVTLGYDVQFSEGKAVEQFVFKVNGDNALLVNYNINSPVLITK